MLSNLPHAPQVGTLGERISGKLGIRFWPFKKLNIIGKAAIFLLFIVEFWPKIKVSRIFCPISGLKLNPVWVTLLVNVVVGLRHEPGKYRDTPSLFQRRTNEAKTFPGCRFGSGGTATRIPFRWLTALLPFQPLIYHYTRTLTHWKSLFALALSSLIK